MANVMFDILGRQINEGDVVVVKGNGSMYGGSTKFMEVGIRHGESIKTLSCSRNPKDKFLVVNPSKEELEIKEQILEKMEGKKPMKVAKDKAKTVGTIYKLNRHSQLFVYMGNVKVESYKDTVLSCTQEGNLYINLGWNHKDLSKFKSMTQKELIDYLREYRHLCVFGDTMANDFEFVKSYKVYDEVVGSVTGLEDEILIHYDWSGKIDGVFPYEEGIYRITKK